MDWRVKNVQYDHKQLSVYPVNYAQSVRARSHLGKAMLHVLGFVQTELLATALALAMPKMGRRPIRSNAR